MHALIETLYATGLRVSELLALPRRVLTTDDRVLTIKGRRRFEANQGEHVVLGRRYGEFTRVFELPEGIAEDQLRAEIADGVLTLSVPKHPAAKPRKIQVLSKGPKQLTE